MLPARLRSSLYAVNAVAAATLIRSILFDRWITVFASVLLLLSARAALRGRSWGLGVAFGTAVAFPVATALGIAPAWFVLVGLLGVLPWARSAKYFSRVDPAATAVGTVIAATLGALGAVGWWLAAPALFAAVPALEPGYLPNHLGLAAMTTLALIAMAARPAGRGQGRKASAATGVRVAVDHAEVTASEDEGELVERDDAAIGQRRVVGR